MLNSVLSNLKSLANPEIVSNLKKISQENMGPEALKTFAKKALGSLPLTEDEIQTLRGKLKLEMLGEKATFEIERIATGLVNKLVQGDDQQVGDDVRTEIVAMLVELNTTPKNVLSNLKYVNEVIVATAPRSLSDVKNLRTTLLNRLVADAKKRIEERANASTSEQPEGDARADQDSVQAEAEAAQEVNPT